MPGIEAAGPVYSQQTANQYYLYTYRIQTDENLKNLNPLADVVRENATLLDRYNLSIFARDPLNPDELSLINETYGSQGSYARIESINMNIINSSAQTVPIIIDSEGDAVEITGWAIDKRNEGRRGQFSSASIVNWISLRYTAWKGRMYLLFIIIWTSGTRDFGRHFPLPYLLLARTMPPLRSSLREKTVIICLAKPWISELQDCLDRAIDLNSQIFMDFSDCPQDNAIELQKIRVFGILLGLKL